MKRLILVLFLALPALYVLAAPPYTIRQTLNWEERPEAVLTSEGLVDYWRFEGAVASSAYPGLPFFVTRFPVDGPGKLRVEVVRAEYEPFEWERASGEGYLTETLQFESSVTRHREGYFGKIAFAPIIQRAGRYERLRSFELRISLQPGNAAVAMRDPDNTFQSVLRDGSIYKIAIAQTGMHKLTYNFLKDELQIDIDNIDPDQIKLYGNTGGPLPYFTEVEREDDLVENAIFLSGGEDGSFDQGDYILFYAEGADVWRYNPSEELFSMQKNIYDTRNYYFLKISPEPGLRISSRPSAAESSYSTESFDDYVRLEEERVNLLHEWTKAQGSGQRFFGDHFKVTRSYEYTDVFNFPNFIPSEPVRVDGRFAARARIPSSFTLEMDGQTLESNEAERVTSINSSSDNIRSYARTAALSGQLLLSGGQLPFTVRYPFPQGPGDESEGWIDWIQFNVRRALLMTGDQMSFRDKKTLDYGSSTFILGNAGEGLAIWDITNPLQPARQEAQRNGNQLSFNANTGQQLREFVAFNPGAALLQPEAAGPVANQNLHALTEVDMIIVYPEFLEAEALRLANHRSEHSGLTVATVKAGEVYNEFASGRAEPTAIRDFARMLYDRSDRFKYLLLFGDGSFDNRDLYGLGQNFLPTYQKPQFNPVETYPSDDFYAILYSGSESNPLRGDIYIGVGRLPVKTEAEAAEVVDKIVLYDTERSSLGDWRNQLVFVGDDDDGVGDKDHARETDLIAERIQESNPAFNLEKIYLDAFPQESTPGGERIPRATEALNQWIFKGALVVTYLGHGGSKGWAQERVLNLSDIFSWENTNEMPVFITATCSFSGYDDPTFVTAGEEVLLNSQGGAISLMTTVRAVYASANEEMTERALNNLFQRGADGQPPTLGDAFRNAKNELSGNFDIDNSRKFTLLGDPSMQLALPRFRVRTTSVNGTAAGTGVADTLRALQQVTVQGEVVDQAGNRLEDFNGILYPTVFDKALQARTLGQDENNSFSYRLQQNVLFKGRASVRNGAFEFTFVVPKDINYELGLGKFSYYAAEDGNMMDANGSFEEIVIGGTATDGISDNEGPRVEVFMNTEDFVFGSTVSANPTLLVKLQDDNGINVVGNSIGHDLEGVLNEDTQNTYLLNDFYESDLDDYTSGQVRYPMDDLPEGRHRIQVKAWDVANNSSEGYTEFVVASSEEVALQQVLNYPNPFTDRTCFQFDHNLANQEIDVMVQIYTVSGRLVKTLQQSLLSDGALRQDDCIEWDGRDDFGGRLARGVYLYKVKVRSVGPDARSGESDFEKLVILK